MYAKSNKDICLLKKKPTNGIKIAMTMFINNNKLHLFNLSFMGSKSKKGKENKRG
jgi:hypothetical protein